MGTNWLIRNGAVLVSSVNEVMEELGESLQGPTLQVEANLTGEEKKIVNLLKLEAMDADEISRKLKKNISEVLVMLSNLGLKGVVEEIGGSLW